MHKIKFEYRITVIYLLVGGGWIIFSDKFVQSLTSNNAVLTELQTYKGWFYVCVTAILLFFMVKKHLLKIRKAEQEAIKSNELKSAFLQNISHEIRTPMNSIIGFSDLLQFEDLSQKNRQEYTTNIINSSNQLLSIVDELMDISLIETGNMKVYESRFNLNQFLDEIVASFHLTLKKEIEFSIEKGLSDELSTIKTDEHKLRQVIQNLLTNSNKYTETGKIILTYSVSNEEIKFCIRDTGIGIPHELKELVFERFRQINESNKKLNDGVGLGLAICKGHIELLNGKIWLESEAGKGTSFYFTIPLKRT
ncbi:HAMP domain-containing sensor histidine kinase [uncultured Draconibacterium sp.]|uniref:sensor histidine kinase n=1 Tax=uncultured Draconibacterium sp. TaxID=1573823 RepID=UPI003217C18A